MPTYFCPWLRVERGVAVPRGCRDIGLIRVLLGFLRSCIENLLVEMFLRLGFWRGFVVFCRVFFAGFFLWVFGVAG
jgi:hypothetical protein